MTNLILLSPLNGWSTPLEEVPDEVFSSRMLGDGVAIDPTSATLHAPCNGQIVTALASKHALTLRTEQGTEILMHIGIDTVALRGQGFELHVSAGCDVRAGERLLSFDLDLLARRAKSLLTPLIVMDGSGTVVRRHQNREVRVGDFLMEVVASTGKIEIGSPAIASEVSRRVVVLFEDGIHARPAALLVNCLRSFSATVSVSMGNRSANARSVTALMSLGVNSGDEITLTATGLDARAAVAMIETVILAGKNPSHRARLTASESSKGENGTGVNIDVMSSSEAKTLRGVIASRGLAVGYAAPLSRPELQVAEAGCGVAHEGEALDRARAVVKSQLEITAGVGEGAASEIVAAHLQLIDDPELLQAARNAIAAGKSAGFAWRRSLRAGIDALRSLNDPRMAERADDLLDIESQVLVALTGRKTSATQMLPERAILLAHDILPSQLMTIEPGKIAGICLAAGGATSHVAILAAALGIPMLVAAGHAILRIPKDAILVLDAEQGLLCTAPTQEQLDAAEVSLSINRSHRAAEIEVAQRECRMADGFRIEVYANVGSLAEAHAAVRNGAEGCGLLRTEFLFLDRQSAPDEAEQVAEYQRIADAFAGRPITMRTLDVGGDKPIPYLPLPHEDNPALGLRGVRTSLLRQDLLRTQLRAVLQVRPAAQCRLLLPMITSLNEVQAVRAILEEMRRDLGRKDAIALGVMIETPAAAMLADQIAREVDFFSIGTNDLTQYTLAMDRGHSELAVQLDALHPSVLRLIARTAEAACASHLRVAMCGGLASDPAAVPILIGLGVHELSVVPAVIPQLKSTIAMLTMENCVSLAKQALQQVSPQAVRAMLAQSRPSLDEDGTRRRVSP